VSLLLCVRLAALSGVVVVVSMCRVSSGTDLIVPFAVFEKDGEGGGLFWMLGFPPPFRVFMAYEETGERVLAGALIVSIFRSMPTAGS
jgi:hypothetical protein